MTIPKILLVVFLIFGPTIALIGYLGYLYPPYVTEKASSEAVEQQTTLDNLLDAIEWVESRGDANAIGDNGNAVGAYQIWKIYVDDVNNINIFGPRYSYEDRWDKTKSRAMTKTYLYWYVRFTRGIIKKPEWDDKKWEYMARIHNGGPNGWKKESTKPYWEKVKARLEW